MHHFWWIPHKFQLYLYQIILIYRHVKTSNIKLKWTPLILVYYFRALCNNKSKFIICQFKAIQWIIFSRSCCWLAIDQLWYVYAYNPHEVNIKNKNDIVSLNDNRQTFNLFRTCVVPKTEDITWIWDAIMNMICDFYCCDTLLTDHIRIFSWVNVWCKVYDVTACVKILRW